MFLEGVFITVSYMLVLQSSSLYMSLLLVPLSFILMIMIKMNLVKSSLFLFIYVMIFIGGLLILLVGVTATLAQEQGTFPNYYSIYFILFASFLLVLVSSHHTSMNLAGMFFWLGYNWIVLMMMCIILVLSLLVISFLSLFYKGMMRGECPFSVSARLSFVE